MNYDRREISSALCLFHSHVVHLTACLLPYFSCIFTHKNPLMLCSQKMTKITLTKSIKSTLFLKLIITSNYLEYHLIFVPLGKVSVTGDC